MCGIAGVVCFHGSPAPDRERLRAMCAEIRHRGPDDEGILIDGPVALGMRRLSVIDVAGGQQPLFNEDRSVKMVFNGEIYNYRELREELVARGHTFSSNSDGEVVVHLWEEIGTKFVERLNGMFAIALYDSRQARIILARDHLGIKPLFYARLDNYLVFGSEIKSILASGLVARELDVDALGQFVSWEYVPAPQTLFRAVRKLDGAELMDIEVADASVTIQSWWDLPAGNGVKPLARRESQEWTRLVDCKLRACVRRQLVSDVPLGAFLSGGVDSSLVVAAMGEANTFSIGFDDPSYNELRWSHAVAEHLGVSHESEVIRPKIVDLFDHLMHFMEDPIGDFSIFPTYLVSQLARRHVTVVLSGDGGDELFGGYETYVAQQKARLWSKMPSFLRKGIMEPLLNAIPPRPEKKGLINKAKRFVEGVQYDEALHHARWRLFVGETLRGRLFSPEALRQMHTPVGSHILQLFDRAGNRPELDRSLYVDLKSYLCDNCLVKVDRMSMACSLEARVPFLDRELVDLACQIPTELKVHGDQTKVLLKEVAAQHLPAASVYRPKEGFSIPIKSWLRTEFRPLLEELLDPRKLGAEGLFQPQTVERLKREHLQGRENHSHILWSMIVFADWRKRWAV